MQAKYAYRSIAQFVRHVTGHPREYLERHPFPELRIESEEAPKAGREREEDAKPLNNSATKQYGEERPPLGIDEYNSGSDIELYKENEEIIRKAVRDGQVDKTKEFDRTEHRSSSNFHESEASNASISPKGEAPQENVASLQEVRISYLFQFI